jgi:hypothetical protein
MAQRVRKETVFIVSLLLLPPAYRLLNHLIRSLQHADRNRQIYLFRRFEVDDKLKLRRLLDRQLAGLGTFENLVDVNSRAAKRSIESAP